MCGIAGYVCHEPVAPEDQERLDGVNSLLFHRGPDGGGQFVDNHVLLFMRRLSIIDRTGGWQPLYNEDRSLALVANGEIYNDLELRPGLKSRGHRFATGSDCETILHLYEEDGPDCVSRLRGMFAFALWDSRRQRLLLARDRMGEKPLYLHEEAGALTFASELKALVKGGCVPFELDAEAVNLFFHYGYVPEPRTAVQGVRKLPAGHYLLIDVPDWRLTERCYWKMEDIPPLTGNPPELIRAELDRIADLVVRSEVPMGVALSGGLDSSLIALLVARKYPGKLQAFTVGYEGSHACDERADARALAEHLDIPWHSVALTTQDVVETFPEVAYWDDDPIADISGHGYYAVMKLAREHDVPVLLQGHGGDELFWGYPWVRQAVAQTQQKDAFFRTGSLPTGSTFTPDQPHPAASNVSWLRQIWRAWKRRQDQGAVRRRIQALPAERMIFQDLAPDYAIAQQLLPGWYTGDFTARLAACSGPDSLFTSPRPWPQIDMSMTRLICQTYLLENGIAQGDRLSMAWGVEMRLPLVDYRLVETVVGLRQTQPDHHLPPKAWFKEAVRGLVPDWVMHRPKRGFHPPFEEWRRALFQEYGRLLDGGHLVEQGILTPRMGRRLAQQPILSGWPATLSFKALFLEMWCRAFGAKPGTARRTPLVRARREFATLSLNR